VIGFDASHYGENQKNHVGCAVPMFPDVPFKRDSRKRITIQQQNRPLKRTKWAERHVEEFLSLPLVSEFVFRSPQTLDGTQREVADLLVAHGEIGILVSQKCQEEPSRRSLAKTSSWARKQAPKAVSQLRGALRSAGCKAVWCDHPRRGRVQFPQGLPKIDHGIVLVEVFERVNDFLNLALELRTIPELLEYLTARRSLPDHDLRIIGDERSLFEFYLLSNGSLQGCACRVDAQTAVAGQEDRLGQVLSSKWESDQYSILLEHVADQLATQHPDCTSGLPSHLLARFDPPGGRTTSLEMQGVLANLRLRERAELGRAFDGAMEKIGN
jgi:hypothetical protein